MVGLGRNCSGIVVIAAIVLAADKSQVVGSTVYVIRLTEDFKEVEFWNAKTGDCFYFEKTLVDTKFLCFTMSQHYKQTKSNTSKICPMKSVGAIVTFDNILVNNPE